MSVLLEGDTVITADDTLWSGMWQFAKDKKVGVSFNYQWVSCSLPRDLLDFVSFVPSPSDPVPVPVVTHSGRGRGRGRGRSSSSGGRGVGRASRGGRMSSVVSQLSAASADLDVSGEASLEVEGVEGEGEQEDKGAEGGDSKSADGSDINTDQGDIEDKVDLALDSAVLSDPAVDTVSMDVEEEGAAPAVPAPVTPVVIERDHPLFGLWTGSFDVRGVNGELDKVQESFFFHSFMHQDPSDDLIDLPQEPQFTSLILRRNRTDVRKSQVGLVNRLPGSAPSSDTIPQPGGVPAPAEGPGPQLTPRSLDPEVIDSSEGEEAPLALEDPDAEAPSSSFPQGAQELSMAVGEPFTKYIVGFGRNPFGRFSLTASLNEVTGHMRCEKKYITSKGSGRRGRRPGSTFGSASRLSIDSTGSDGNPEGASTVRAMSTRPRKSLPDASFFFPSSYDEAQQLLASGPHLKKRKSAVFEDLELGGKAKEKSGGSHQKGSLPGSTPTAVQLQREKDREKDRERAREKERDMELEKELDDSNSDYRVAFLDDESGEIYEGGWYPHSQRRHGAGICLYADGTLYEGGWVMGRESGKGQLMTGDRTVIYIGEWADGTMTGHGTYNFNNGDRYTGDWREGIRHGKGEYLMSSGCSYVGDWKNNKRTGGGLFHWADGSTYDGDWENDNRHGRGLLALANGFRYDGQWFHNYMEGRGLSVFPGGQEYQGSYKAGLREGRGSIKFAHGAVYEGRFRDDRIDGQGTIVVTETMPGAEEGEILIPIQIQADIRRIHLKAGFGADAAH